MPLQLSHSHRELVQVAHHILDTHTITRRDQQVIVSALSSDSVLAADLQRLIQKIFDHLQKGILNVID